MKALILALFVFAACTSAYRGIAIQDRTDVINFAQGFLVGISESTVFDDIKACINDSETFFRDLSTAIADISSKDPERVKRGIALLGEAAMIVPKAAKECRAAQKDIQKLVALLKAFTNPTSFAYHISKSLLINRVEVYNEVTQAVKAYNNRDFYNLGYWTGKAMNTIFLGLNRLMSADFVNFLNEQNNGWTAELPEKFKGMTLAQIKAQYLGAEIVEVPDMEETVFDYEGSVEDVPTYFNASEEWPGCVHEIRDQGKCGSCWAFAATEVLSDRFCIASDKKIDVVLSPQYLVSCNSLNLGCNGGIPLLAWRFLINSGAVTDSCWPYQSSTGVSPKCSEFKKCHDGADTKFYHATKGSIVTLKNPASVQNNLMKFGPVEGAFNVYEDFLSYKSGIYKHTSGALLGGHAVKIIGWGREGSTDFWIVANSWSTTWGENGFFRIAFGQCGIDKSVTAAEADIKKAQISFMASMW